MTEELYDQQETQIALEALGALSAALPEPFVVLGGWAVYLTVLESYRPERLPEILSDDFLRLAEFVCPPFVAFTNREPHVHSL